MTDKYKGNPEGLMEPPAPVVITSPNFRAGESMGSGSYYKTKKEHGKNKWHDIRTKHKKKATDISRYLNIPTYNIYKFETGNGNLDNKEHLGRLVDFYTNTIDKIKF